MDLKHFDAYAHKCVSINTHLCLQILVYRISEEQSISKLETYFDIKPIFFLEHSIVAKTQKDDCNSAIAKAQKDDCNSAIAKAQTDDCNFKKIHMNSLSKIIANIFYVLNVFLEKNMIMKKCHRVGVWYRVSGTSGEK